MARLGLWRRRFALVGSGWLAGVRLAGRWWLAGRVDAAVVRAGRWPGQSRGHAGLRGLDSPNTVSPRLGRTSEGHFLHLSRIPAGYFARRENPGVTLTGTEAVSVLLGVRWPELGALTAAGAAEGASDVGLRPGEWQAGVALRRRRSAGGASKTGSCEARMWTGLLVLPGCARLGLLVLRACVWSQCVGPCRPFRYA